MSLYKGKFVHPTLMSRYTHKPMCANCGRDAALIGDVVVCSECNSNFVRDSREEISTKHALRKIAITLAMEKE